MKTTYLVNGEDSKGNISLRVASEEEWKAITASNKGLPAGERRYFISDCIVEGNDMDLLVIEVSYEDHLKWNTEHMKSVRNIKEGKKYLHVSLNAPFKGNSELELGECIPFPISFESDVLERYNTEQMREKLREWKPWAVDFFDEYLDGNAKGSAVKVANKHGIPERTAYSYKRQFENYLLNRKIFCSF